MREKLRAKWSTRYSYISHKPCGCLAMVVIDNPVHRKEVAIEVARAIQRGERIKRVTTILVKKMDWLCPKHRLEEVLDSSQPLDERIMVIVFLARKSLG